MHGMCMCISVLSISGGLYDIAHIVNSYVEQQIELFLAVACLL